MKDFKEAFEKTRLAGSIAAGALDEVSRIIKPGISTNEIETFCNKCAWHGKINTLKVK